VTSDELTSLNDAQLIAFADEVLSIAIPYGTPRNKILTRIVNAAVAVRDGI
jgi:hypothetical protein